MWISLSTDKCLFCIRFLQTCFFNLAIRLSSRSHELDDYLLKSERGIEKMVDTVSSILNCPKDVSLLFKEYFLLTE
jgi:hypothetical protein